MKYHDSIVTAEKKMYAAIKQLQLWHIAATPVNYAVSYGYLDKHSKSLNAAIEKQLATVKKLDNFFLEQIYSQYILVQSAFRGELIDELDEVLIDLQTNSKQSSVSTKRLVTQLDDNMARLHSTDKDKVLLTIKKIRQITQEFKLEQEKVFEQLLVSKSQLRHCAQN
jgi:diguanylate cyclase